MEAKEQIKATKEDLQNWVHQLAEQNKQLRTTIAKLNMANSIKRQEFLFDVLRLKNLFPEDIVETAIKQTTEFLFDQEEGTEDGKSE